MACYLVDISLFFCKAELTQAFFLYFLEEVVLEEFFDDGILERVAGVIGSMKICGGVVVEEIVDEIACRIERDVHLGGSRALWGGVWGMRTRVGAGHGRPERCRQIIINSKL